MPAATPLQILQTRLAAYQAAELKILSSQEYEVGDGVTQRRNRRADLKDVQDKIDDLSAQITVLQAVPDRRVRYLR